ncbi:hypothetical protein EDB82DRAFT_117337 [Fusarium venenatum]|nr:hypothetical protein EDB82DRAFT_117337 [Fusarium venenatum]
MGRPGTYVGPQVRAVRVVLSVPASSRSVLQSQQDDSVFFPHSVNCWFFVLITLSTLFNAEDSSNATRTNGQTTSKRPVYSFAGASVSQTLLEYFNVKRNTFSRLLRSNVLHVAAGLPSNNINNTAILKTHNIHFISILVTTYLDISRTLPAPTKTPRPKSYSIYPSLSFKMSDKTTEPRGDHVLWAYRRLKDPASKNYCDKINGMLDKTCTWCKAKREVGTLAVDRTRHIMGELVGKTADGVEVWEYNKDGHSTKL